MILGFVSGDGHSCVVESEILYEALKSLPEKQRKVMLLDFWHSLTDGKIHREDNDRIRIERKESKGVGGSSCYLSP